MSDRGFNETHPELKPGEVFLGNFIPGRVLDGREDIEIIGWKTKRIGLVAYGRSGNRLQEYKPVFVQKAELDAAGLK